MKTFIIISDSHFRTGAVGRVERLFPENDFIVHLGDGAGEMRPFAREFPEKFYVMKGNCDFSYGNDECVIEAEGVSVLCCHGHRYGVKRGLDDLVARAKELGCTVALYGHTHIANIEERDGVLCINPGALGDYAQPSYCFMAIHQGKVTPSIVLL